MNKSIGYIFTFIVGATAGAVVSWKILENKYAQLAQEEIESVKAIFSDRYNKNIEEESEETSELPSTQEKLDMEAYKRAIQKLNYGSADEKTVPYIISPEEFGTIEGYDTECLSYYADGVLADDFGDTIEDIDAVVGHDSLKRIGEYVDDIIHVRNDKDKTDYEITRDLRTFDEAVPQKTIYSDDEE